MILLVDIGNTRVHVALADAKEIRRTAHWSTEACEEEGFEILTRWIGNADVRGVSLASVVPRMTQKACRFLSKRWQCPILVLTSRTLKGLPMDYPRPKSVGADRLANALAAVSLAGAPVLAIDAGTAVTFDVVDRRGFYVGGVIAPGRALMALTLHERTAMLPRVRSRRVNCAIGRTTQQAILIGSDHGWLGLVREIVAGIHRQLGGCVPVLVTGGDAKWLIDRLPDLGKEAPNLTLLGLWKNWIDHYTGA